MMSVVFFYLVAQMIDISWHFVLPSSALSLSPSPSPSRRHFFLYIITFAHPSSAVNLSRPPSISLCLLCLFSFYSGVMRSEKAELIASTSSAIYSIVRRNYYLLDRFSHCCARGW